MIEVVFLCCILGSPCEFQVRRGDAVRTGTARVDPISTSCSRVLNLDIVVGWTSALGREKSQYRENVLGKGREA